MKDGAANQKMACFQFPVDDLLLPVACFCPQSERSNMILHFGMYRMFCGVQVRRSMETQQDLASSVLFMRLSWGNLPESQTKHFYGFPQALPPHLVEKLKHTIMGGSVETSRHYYSRFSRLFFRLWIQSINEEHI